MAKVISTPTAAFRGKLGGMVFSQQPDGTTTVRSAWQKAGRSTPGEKKSQHRMTLGNLYVRGVLKDPAAVAEYAPVAERRKVRVRDAAMSDYMTDPVILDVDANWYHGQPGDAILVITGDDFKVVHVSVVLRSSSGPRVEEGSATPQGASSQVWTYAAQTQRAQGEELIIEVTATDRCGNSTLKMVPHEI